MPNTVAMLGEAFGSGELLVPRSTTYEHSVEDCTCREDVGLLIEDTDEGLVGTIEGVEVGGLEGGVAVGTFSHMTHVYEFGDTACLGRKHDVGRSDVVVTERRALPVHIFDTVKNLQEETDCLLYLHLAFALYLLDKQFTTEIVGNQILIVARLKPLLTIAYVTYEVGMTQS